MAFTSIKIPIKVELDFSTAQSDLSSFISNMESQVSRAGSQASGGSKVTGPAVQGQTDIKAIMDDIRRSISDIPKAIRDEKSRRQEGDGAPPRKGGGGGGSGGGSSGGGGGGGNNVPVPPQGSSGFAGRGRNPVQVLTDVAKYRVASAAVNTLFDGFNKGVNTVTEVQNELTQLNKVLNTSQKNLDSLKNAAVSTAQEFGKSTVGVLKGFRIFAQQGLPTDEVIKFGKSVALASNVSTFGEEGLSELITAGVKTFGKQEVGDTGLKLVDKFLKVEGARAVSEADLADVFKRIGPQAGAAGIGIDELNALTTIIKERTRSESGEIATALRFVIKNLQSDKTQKALKEILPNLDFVNEQGDLRDPYDVLNQIAKDFGGLNRKQKGRVATEIGETRFASRTIALLEGLSQGEGQQIINLGRGAEGETFRRNQIVMQSLQKQVQKTGAAFENFALASGTNLVAPATTLLRTMEKVLNVVTSISNTKLFGDNGSVGSLLSSTAAVGGGALALRFLGLGGGLGKLGGLAMGGLASGGAVAGGVGGAALGGGAAGLGGAAIGGILGTALGQILKKGIVSLGVGAALPASLGALAGPLGLILGVAISTIAEKALRNAFETSKERLDRTGVTDDLANTKQTLDSFQGIESQQKAIEQSRADIAKANAIGGPDQQNQAIRRGEIDRTSLQATRDLTKQLKSQKNALLDNEEALTEAGAIISKNNNIFFKDNKGARKNVQESPEAMRNLLNAVIDPKARKQSLLEVTRQLDSFGERLEGARKEEGSDLKKLETTLDKRGEGLTAQDRRILSQGQKTVSNILSGDLDALSKAVEKGATGADLEKALQGVSSESKSGIEELLEKSTGLQRNKLANTPGLQEKAIVNQLATQQFTNLTTQAKELTDNLKTNLNAGAASQADISAAVQKAAVGDIVELFDKDRRVQSVGKVTLDDQGNKILSLITLQQKQFGKDFNIFSQAKKIDEKFNVGEFSRTSLLEAFSKNLGVAIFGTKSKQEEQKLEAFDPFRTSVGFGAGFSRTLKAFDSGATSLQDVSDQVAGSFRGFSAEGTPMFDTSLQDVFRQLQTTQDGLATSLQGAEQGQIDSTAVDSINKKRIEVEAGGVLSKAVESLGRVFKSFDASVDKLRAFKIEQKNLKDIPVIQTGALAKQFGDAIPQFALGPDKDQLSAEDKAKLALPNLATSLQEAQVRIGAQRDLTTGIDLEEDKLLKFLESAGTSGLASLDPNEFSKVLAPLGDSAKQVETTFAKLITAIEPGDTPDRAETLDRLVGVVKQAFDTQRTRVSQAFAGTSDQAKVAEVSLKTAVNLSQLQTAAEQAARSLALLEKFKGFDNLNRALGQGPFGVVGPGGGPRIFRENIFGEKTPLDFSRKNQFEIERELIGRRRNKEKLFDENGNQLSSLTDQQASEALRDVRFRESDAKKGVKLNRQRQVLQENQQVATQFISSLDEVLANKTLTGNARAGLSNIQRELIGISERPEKAFLTPRGDINLEPFSILKNLGGRIESLIPKDIQGDVFKNANEQQRSSLLRSGAVSQETADKVKAQEAAASLEPMTSRQDATNAILSKIEAKIGDKAGQGDQGKITLLDKLSGLLNQLFNNKNGPAGTSTSVDTKKPVPVTTSITDRTQLQAPSAISLGQTRLSQESIAQMVKKADEARAASSASSNVLESMFMTPQPEQLFTPNTPPEPEPSPLDGGYSLLKAVPTYTGVGNNIERKDVLDSKNSIFGALPNPQEKFNQSQSTAFITARGNDIAIRDKQKQEQSAQASLLPENVTSEPFVQRNKSDVITLAPNAINENLRESNKVNKEKESKSGGTEVASAVEKAISNGAGGLGSTIVQALEEGGSTFAGKLNSTLQTLIQAMQAKLAAEGGSKTVGGQSVSQESILQALTTKVSEVEAKSANKFEEINSSINQSITELRAKIEETAKQITEGSSTQNLRSKLDSILSEVNDLRSLTSKAYEIANIADINSSNANLRIPQLEAQVNEIAGIARAAQGLATQAWGNQR